VTRTRERVQRDVVRLVHRGLAPRDFALAAMRALRPAVDYDGVCLLMLDPATLLPTDEVVENGLPPAVMPRLTEIEIREPDVNKFASLAGRPVPAASLSDATASDLDRSRRQRELRGPNGFGDELRAMCGAEGGLTLLRTADRPYFTGADVRFVASLAGILADGLRRAALLHATATADGPGLVLLDGDDRIESADRAGQRWLDRLGGAPLPSVVLAVAARARADDGRDLARARVRTNAGAWVIVRGSLLGDGPDARVAILIEPVQAAELAPLIADAYGLSDRERRVTELVAQGLSTTAIAARLHLSAYTVQDHLKAIFDKTGTGSRGDLVARLFFTHYAPRLSGNGSGHS
jgi:DNA-binding CsgD family transcriptional regulator